MRQTTHQPDFGISSTTWLDPKPLETPLESPQNPKRPWKIGDYMASSRSKTEMSVEWHLWNGNHCVGNYSTDVDLMPSVLFWFHGCRMIPDRSMATVWEATYSYVAYPANPESRHHLPAKLQCSLSGKRDAIFKSSTLPPGYQKSNWLAYLDQKKELENDGYPDSIQDIHQLMISFSGWDPNYIIPIDSQRKQP